MGCILEKAGGSDRLARGKEEELLQQKWHLKGRVTKEAWLVLRFRRVGLISWGRVFSSLLGSGEPWKCSEQEVSADIIWVYSGPVEYEC